LTRAGRLRVVLVLNVALVAGLVIVGSSAHSLGVLAEGADYLADAAAIGVSLLAIWLSDRPPTQRRPDGHPNATNVAALVNGAWLLILSFLVIAGAIDRLATGTHQVHGLPVLVVSGIAAVAMLGSAALRTDLVPQVALLSAGCWLARSVEGKALRARVVGPAGSGGGLVA